MVQQLWAKYLRKVFLQLFNRLSCASCQNILRAADTIITAFIQKKWVNGMVYVWFFAYLKFFAKIGRKFFYYILLCKFSIYRDMALKWIFWGFCINRFLISPFHHLSSRSYFGFEFAEIFIIEKRLSDSPSWGVNKIV